MIGSFLSKAIALALGYAYPAYDCFKTVESNKPEIEQLRFWCQYWILVAALTVFERVGESFISWLPMYSEAKLAFFVYLWYPKTKGTSYVYETFFRPYVAKHETEIDRNLLELRTRAGDMVVVYSQRIVSYGQTRVFEILQYVASQSASQSSRPCPAQHRQPLQAHQRALTAAARPQPLPDSSTMIHPQETTKVAAASSAAAPLPSTAQPQSTGITTTTLPSSSETTSSSAHPNEPEAMQVESTNNAASNEDKNNPLPQETVMEEAIRMTRGRLRKRAATASSETR